MTGLAGLMAWNPILAGAIAYGAVVGGTCWVAFWTEGQVQWNNPGLFFGDAALAVVVIAGGYALRSLHRPHWFGNGIWQLALMTIGLCLWLGVEALSRRDRGGIWAMSFADIYHWYAAGWFFALIAVAICAIWTAAFIESTHWAWRIVVVAGAAIPVFLWAALALKGHLARQH